MHHEFLSEDVFESVLQKKKKNGLNDGTCRSWFGVGVGVLGSRDEFYLGPLKVFSPI